MNNEGAEEMIKEIEGGNMTEEMIGGTEADEKKEREEHEKLAKAAKEQFEKMVENYLAGSSSFMQHGNISASEFEVRFGSNPRLAKPVSKIDYDNVVKQLYSCGFKPQVEDGTHLLRINSEYIDTRTGITKMSNIRAEITGLDMIQEYCRTNSLQKIIDMPSTVFNKLKFTKKSPPKSGTGENVRPLDMPDFNFRVSHQLEQDFNIHTNIARNIIAKWSDSKKLFRC